MTAIQASLDIQAAWRLSESPGVADADLPAGKGGANGHLSAAAACKNKSRLRSNLDAMLSAPGLASLVIANRILALAICEACATGKRALQVRRL